MAPCAGLSQQMRLAASAVAAPFLGRPSNKMPTFFRGGQRSILGPLILGNSDLGTAKPTELGIHDSYVLMCLAEASGVYGASPRVGFWCVSGLSCQQGNAWQLSALPQTTHQQSTERP